MMPLLCVAARYGSTVARSFARMMPSRTCAPLKPLPSRLLTGTTICARASARSVRFDRMRRNTLPPVIDSTSDATPSHIVLTRLAPIASQRVHEQMQHDHLAAVFRRDVMEQLDVACTAAARHHLRVQAVGQTDDFVAVRLQRARSRLRIAHVDELHLADQDRFGRARL